ncbi:NAD dependent epimerase/dehydratase [Sarocladium implicatum]|nr:NAD dependent epimerase/dehydratase [Sarocladium implicatum]
MVLTSAWWQFLENWVYGLPEPPARVRTKPLRLICIGPPRTGTESLRTALDQLGFEAYHGWDALFEKENYNRSWARLCARKYLNKAPGLPITAEEFDMVMGHAEVIMDGPACALASELIAAYPDAKVVLTLRPGDDMVAWAKSLDDVLLKINENWVIYLLSWFDSKVFWKWNNFWRYTWPGFFKCIDSRMGYAAASRATGVSVYKEHCNMIRGLVPADRLLEWRATDGWAPICELLDMEIPDEPFPHVNTKDKHFQTRMEQIMSEVMAPAVRNCGIFVTLLVGSVAAGIYYSQHS